MTTLKSIITHMIDRAEARPGKPVIEHLGRGLSIQIKAGQDGNLELTLRRFQTVPSKREAQIVLASFPFPATVEKWDNRMAEGYYYVFGQVTTGTDQQPGAKVEQLELKAGSDEQASNDAQ